MQLVNENLQKNQEQAQAWTAPQQASARLAGYTAIAGCVTMVIGAILWVTSGTDLWMALNAGDVGGYLAAVAPVKMQVVANLSVWIVGVLTLGVAAPLLSEQCTQRPVLAKVGLTIYRIAVPLVVVSYIVMLAVVVQLAGDQSATAVAIGKVVGWIGVRADDLATALILGAGPFVFSMAARGEWVTPWLGRLGYLCGILGLVSIVAMYSPALTSLGFIIIPVGMAWLVWAGVIMLRSR